MPMFKILVDTCVWLDLAKDHKSGPVLDVLEMLVKNGKLELLVPRIVVDEFARNKARVAKEGVQSLSRALRRVREAVWTLDVPGRRGALAKRLTDLDLKLPSLSENAVAAIGKIDALMKGTTIIETSSAVKVRGAERALAGRAPFHRSKNSMADAILIEIYADAQAAAVAKGTRFAFVTHNKHDFSQPNGDHRKPHPDFAPLFSKIRSLYCVTLVDLLRRVDASLLTDQMMLEEWSDEPRSASAILDAIDELFDKIWYNRHIGLRIRVDSGEVANVETETYPRPVGAPDTITPGVLALALKAARRVEQRRGIENLGPWDDFDWGMLNGKLSALRWVLGDEWDMLDT
jgi:predicted nucleic acid-binding protein